MADNDVQLRTSFILTICFTAFVGVILIIYMALAILPRLRRIESRQQPCVQGEQR